MLKPSKKQRCLTLISVMVFFITTSLFSQTVTTLTGEINGGTGGVCVDEDGNIYVADFGASLGGAPGTKVFKVTPDGQVTIFATGLSGASGNAFDSKGNLFQSNIASDRISKITPDGVVSTFVSSGISGPVGIAIDEGDNLFVCNCGNNTIRKVTPQGVSTLFASSGLLSCPNGITFDDQGNLYVANFNNGNVLKITSSAKVSFFATVPGNNNGHITFFNGEFYVAGRGANRIYKITLAGVVSVGGGSGVQGLTDGPALQARFSLPNDLAFDPTGQFLYTNDVVNATSSNSLSPMVVRRIDFGNPTSVSDNESIPDRYTLHQNNPNPFNPSTQIEYSLESPSHVVLKIYNFVGEEIRTLVSENQSPGVKTVFWNGRDDSGKLVAGSVYFFRIEAGDFVQTKKMLLVK